MRFTVCDIEKDFSLVGEYLNEKIEEGKNIILLRGDLGAGKTTFVKHFMSYLGGEIADVDSPTFSIVNTYDSTNKPIHHFDLYRLSSAEEIEEIGFMEYIDSGNLCFIEWPQKIAEFLPPNQVVNLDITVSLEQCRDFVFS